MLNKEMTDLHTYLRSLAARYETKEFLVGDPSWFMHQVEGDSDKELLAFMAAALSYGSRKQFLPKIDRLLCHARDYSLQTCATLPHDGIIRRWLEDRAYAEVVPDDDACFYRLYTNRTMNTPRENQEQFHFGYIKLYTLLLCSYLFSIFLPLDILPASS